MVRCPVCENNATIEKLSCPSCKVTLVGVFTLPRLARLDKDKAKLAEHLILSGGNLKVMAERLETSYPTLRKNVDELVSALNDLYKEDEENIAKILSDTEKGKIQYEEAMRRIKEINNEL